MAEEDKKDKVSGFIWVLLTKAANKQILTWKNKKNIASSALSIVQLLDICWLFKLNWHCCWGFPSADLFSF